jgi:hypothetical protein
MKEGEKAEEREAKSGDGYVSDELKPAKIEAVYK